MSKITVQFPQTDVVRVVFSYRNRAEQNTTRLSTVYDENDMVPESAKSNLKQYSYRLIPSLVGQVSVGDAVVVNCATGYQVAEIVSINAHVPMTTHDSLAYIVGKVDMASYFEFLKQKKAIEILREKLEVEKKRLESLVTYELLAERSPEFKELLDSFKALGGTIN